MWLSRTRSLMLVVVFALSVAALPLSGDSEPHHQMEGFDVTPGMDVLHTETSEMDVIECGGEVGAEPVPADIWPSPVPLPSASPLPGANRTFTRSNSSLSQPLAPKCEDDEKFIDTKGLDCRDYTMNKELCRIADRFVNADGRSARHACCRCGGGKHVAPSPGHKCVRRRMGGDAGCEEDMLATDGVQGHAGDGANMPFKSSFSDQLRNQIVTDGVEMGASRSYEDVVREDNEEEEVAENIGTLQSVDSVLEPDSEVFRDRNFLGRPSEPKSPNSTPSGRFSVIGSIKFGMTFRPTFETMYGERIASVLAASAGTEPENITLQYTPGSVIVSYRIFPDGVGIERAHLASGSLSASLTGGQFTTNLQMRHFPRTNMTILTGPDLAAFQHPVDPLMAHGNVHKQYSTVPYTVKNQDTIASIAAQFNVTPALLVSFNPDVADPMLVKTGDVLFVPVPRVLQVSDVSPNESPLEGGVEVVIKGSGFTFPGFCKFGDIVTRATHVVDDVMVCVTPEQQEPGIMSLAVSDGMGGFRDSTVLFHYGMSLLPFCDEPEARPSFCRPRLALYSVSPERIAQDVPQVITVAGAGFNSTASCRINGNPVPTTIVSRSAIECEVGPHNPGTLKVSVNQLGLVAELDRDLVVFGTLALKAIEPENGPQEGNTVITLTGSTFKPGAMCRFNDVTVAGTFVSSSEMTCTAPPHQPGIVNLDVSNDGQFWSPESVRFEYTYLQVSSLSEYHGHVRGGEVITIEGYGFYPGAWCRFGANRTEAEYVSLTSITCEVPPQTAAKVVPVSVSLDGVHSWSEDEHLFEYYGSVTELRPTEGRAVGGEDVHIFGEGFDQFCAYVCRFGIKTVPAVVISSTQVQCTVPPGRGTVDFSIESKDVRYRQMIMGSFMTYTYHGAQDVDIFTVTPAHTDVRIDNATVVLTGTGFVPGTLCRFGDKVALSTFVNQNTIKCVAPMRDLAELVPVTVSHNGGRTWSGLLAYFEYRAVVESLDSPMGPVSGGNSVYVKGYGFNYRVSLCVFGNRVVPANVTNQYELYCEAPPSVAPARVPFAITTNDSVLYDSYLEFAFKEPSASSWGTFYIYSENPGFFMSSIEPAVGSIMGGTPVIAHGQGFDHTSHCRFGDTTVKAEFLDAAAVRCISPPHVSGEVDFRVVIFNRTEGYNVSVLGTPYRYTPPEIQHISPEAGFVTGGELVRITGRYLGGAATCRFGSVSSAVISATDNEVQCNTPPTSVSSTVPVRLEYGGAGSSSGNTMFSYQPVISSMNPQNGHIFSDSQIVTFHGVGFSGDSTRCVFGKTTVPATTRSDTEITCAVPMQTTPTVVTVRVLKDDQASTIQSFTYHYNHVVRDIHPNLGPIIGGSVVVVVGSGLSSVTHCSFDNDRTTAEVISDVMVHCPTPYHPPGLASLALVTDTGDALSSFTSNSMEYTFKIMNTRVESIHPSSGGVGGGTLVTVRGQGFSMGSFCKFGDVEVPVMYYAPDHIACYSPAVESDRSVAVEVSQTGGDEGYSSDGIRFAYGADTSSVNRIDPAWGPEGADIVIHGTNFNRDSVCYFGGQSASTEFIDENLLRCTVPAQGSKPQEIVQVSSDPSQLPGGHVVFHYLKDLSNQESIAVREVVPSTGPTAGGTHVVVHGINFPENALCRFGDLLVPAQVLSETQLECTAPQHRAATVTLEIVSADHASFSSSYIRYTFEGSAGTVEDDMFDSAPAGEPAIERIEPARAAAGQKISIFGQRFGSVGYCVFASGSDSIQERATVVDSSHLICTVPSPVPSMVDSATLKYMSVAGTQSHSVSFKFVVV